MKSPSFLGRLLFFLPLFSPFLLIPQPENPLPPAALLGLALGYGRIAAFIEGRRGGEELLLGLSALPFGLAAAGFYGALGDGRLLLLGAEASLAYLALFLLESLSVPRYRGFALPLGFLLAFSACLLAADRLPPALVLGAAGLAAGLSGYALARRSR